MRRTIVGLAFSLALPAVAWGQAPLLQGGPWTPGHVPQYVGQGSQQPVVIDGGAAAGGAIGANASEIGITARGTGTAPYSAQGSGPFGSIGCLYDAPINNATGYHFLCLSPNSTGGNALVSYGAGGTATPGALNFNINGSVYAFPASGAGTGSVNGPGTTTAGHVAYWNSTNGMLLGDEATIALGNLPSIGANTVLGSIAGGTPAALTATQLTTLCNAFTSSLSGCVPSSGGGTANFLRADGAWTTPAGIIVGSTTVSSGVTQQLLYDNGGVVGEVTKGNSCVYLTSGGGVPSCSQTLPTAVQTNIISLGTVTTGNWNATPITGPYGGTGLSFAAIGDLIYVSATTPTWSRLAAVATGSVLASGGVNTAPAWSAAPTLTSLTLTTSITVPVILGTAVQVGSGGTPTHLAASQTTVPTVGTCGTGAALTGSTDVAGQVHATGATACTMTFNVAYSSQPFCVATDNTTAAGLKVTYSTGVSITVTGLTSGDTFSYVCVGQTGG